MAYKRRYAKRTRKTFKRRSYKKSMYRRRGAGINKQCMKYDGAHKEKIITTGALRESSGIYSNHCLLISWNVNNSFVSPRYSAYRSTTQWT